MSFLYSLKSGLNFKNKKILILKNPLFLTGCFFIASLLLLSTSIFAARLSNTSTTISDSRPSTNNVNYVFDWSGSSANNIRCINIQFCTTENNVCNSPVGIVTTGAIKGSFTGLTAANWTLNNTTNGTLKLTNAAGEVPLANISLNLQNINNPSSAGVFFSRINTYSDIACTNEVDWTKSNFNIQAGTTVSVTITAPSTAGVAFSGKSSPMAFITILRNGSVVATTQANSAGNFSTNISGLSSGIYVFGVKGEDRNGRATTTLYYTLNLSAGTTTNLSGIFLSPTISLLPKRVYRGGVIKFSGEGYPKSTVYLFLSPGTTVKSTKVTAGGWWSYFLNTGALGSGVYDARAREISNGGSHSAYSKTLAFTVLSAPTCMSADLNFNGSVDIVDFSILLYFWKQTEPSNRCADINQDGVVDLIDFSIMMYEWTQR
jgi:hypothetical protein